MNLAIISDLHLEFRSKAEIQEVCDYLNSIKDQDFLLIAGDTHSNKKERKKFFDKLEVHFKYVMGNHDFYKTEVYDDFFDEDGIVGCCLWTNFNNDPLSEFKAGRYIWDYKYIPNWTTQKCKELNEIQVEKIFNSPSEIVVTHFPPAFECISPKHVGDILNPYFNNNLGKRILDSNKKLWVCGHTHVDFDFKIGDCRIVSNCWGYPRELNKNLVVKNITIS